MGIIRKTMSVSTLGLVDYRSDKERIAKYTRQTRNATRVAAAQNAKLIDGQRNQLAQSHVHHVESQVPVPSAPPVQGPPAGWYPDPSGTVRWWDGWRWTEHAQGSAPR